jgi:probable HAF family extracellular repeat protein
MVDIGSLGGTLSVSGVLCCGGGTAGLNNRGQIIGTSTLAGDQVHHAFFWEHGVLTDLGTLGGANSEAMYLTETGEVVGRVDFSPSSTDHHGFVWKDGLMKDLGTLAPWPCSTATGANTRGQVIGETGVCFVGGGPPFLSEHGEPIVDLNALVLPGSDLTLDAASFINERGEIAGDAVLPNGDTRAILLIPCDRDHADFKGCEGHVDEIVTDDMLVTTKAAPSRLGKGSVNHETRGWNTLRFSRVP